MPQGTLLALLAFLAFVSLGLPDGLLGPSWPSIRGAFGLPLDALGPLVGATTAGYLVSSFLSGAILRALPLGAVLALSTAAAATALAGIALAPAWPLVLACGALAGLGGGAIDAGLNAYGATHFSRRTLNWLHAFYGVGAATGPLVVTAVLASGLAWRWSYALVGAAQAVLALTFLLTRRRWGRGADRGSDVAPPPTRRRRSPRCAVRSCGSGWWCSSSTRASSSPPRSGATRCSSSAAARPRPPPGSRSPSSGAG